MCRAEEPSTDDLGKVSDKDINIRAAHVRLYIHNRSQALDILESETATAVYDVDIIKLSKKYETFQKT